MRMNQVVRLLQQAPNGGAGAETRRDCKVIYLSPTKALAQQSMQNFAQKFHRFGLRVAEITGDSTANVCLKEMAQNQLIFTTPGTSEIIYSGNFSDFQGSSLRRRSHITPNTIYRKARLLNSVMEGSHIPIGHG